MNAFDNAIEQALIDIGPADTQEPTDRPSVRALVDVVNRAVDALEAQGPRSERIALQLLLGLVRYESEMAKELAK